MNTHRCRHPYAFLARKLSSKQLRLHCQGGAATSQPRDTAANPSLPGMLQDPSTNPSGFGTSCDPLRPSTSPVETKAAFLLSLGVTTALWRYGAKCGDHDAISTQTCSKNMCFSSILSPWLPEHVTDQACEAPLPTAGKRVLQGGNPKST